MSLLKRLAGVVLLLIVCMVGNVEAGQMPEAFTVSPLIGYHLL